VHHFLRRRAAGGLLAIAFVALHLPFLPASLEDLDSINFALGIRQFDVAQHQPHPPGYPVFIFAAKAVHAVISSEVRALSLLAVFAGGFAVLALVSLFRALDRPGGRVAEAEPLALLATLLVATSPLFWVTSARPLSDAAGLGLALAVQALVLTEGSRKALIIASVVAGIGAGIRSQVVWLTLPLLVLRAARQPVPDRTRSVLVAAVAYSSGVLTWGVPLVLLSGGPSAYLRALFSQGAEDFTGVAMLWTTPTVRQLAAALQNTFVAPWGFVPSGVAVVLFALAGLVVMFGRSRRALGLMAVAFGPYLVFHVLFQETATTRYALPLVVPVAYAAVRGISSVSRVISMPVLLAFSLFNVGAGTQMLYGYSSVEAPAFQMLHDMKASAGSSSPVLAMHRRDDLDLRRPIHWDGLPAVERRLPAPPKHEWLEVVKYWNDGGRQPVWFVADPPRSDLALFRGQRPPARYRWAFSMPSVMGGMRPNEMDWHIIEPPDWYLGEGWAVTPETAGLAKESGHTPGRGGIHGWMRRWPGSATLMIGGRNLGSAGTGSRLSLAVDGRIVDEATVEPGFFLRMLTLPEGSLSGNGDYATVRATADSADLAIEQFDAQPLGRVLFGYGEGWNELEYNPVTGRLWRWTTERATLRARGGGQPLSLYLEGELEEADTSRVVVRVGDRILADQQVGRSFAMNVNVPGGIVGPAEQAITIETSAWYIPAETRWRSRDRRHLGLKIYSCRLVPVS
jgi:hypothetical protein